MLVNATAQEWLSATVFHAKGSVARSMGLDNFGRLYILGSACHVTVGDRRYPAENCFSNRLGYIFQYDNGAITKLINFGDFCTSAFGAVGVTDRNEIYVTGWYCDSLSFDENEIFRRSGRHMFLCKLDSAANPIWSIDETGGQASLLDISADSDVYVGGSYQDSMKIGSNAFYSNDADGLPFRQDAYVSKYSSGGELQWAVPAGGPGLEFIANLECGGDNVFLILFHSDTLVLETNTVISVPDESSTLWAIGKNGKTKWHRTRPGGAYLHGGISYDPTRDLLYVGGWDYYATGSDTHGLYLECYSPNGDVLWRRELHYPSAVFDVEVDTFGNIYVAGSYKQDIVWDGVTARLVTKNTRFVAKLDQTGKCLWIKPMITTPGSYPVDLVVVGEDNAYLLVEAYPPDGKTVFTAADGEHGAKSRSYYIAHLAHPTAEAVRKVYRVPGFKKSIPSTRYNAQGRLLESKKRLTGQCWANKTGPAGFYILENGEKQMRLR